MNSSSIEIGPILSEFKEFAIDFPPELKGLAITNNEAIRAAHNTFAKLDPTSTTSSSSSTYSTASSTSSTITEEANDVYHYISYLPVDGILYELDGLKKGPISHGQCRGAVDRIEWLEMVQPVVQERVNQYLKYEIKFSLLAVVKNRKEMYEAELKEYQIQKERIHQQLDDEISYEDLEKSLSKIDSEIETVQHKIVIEEEKSKNWKKESMRRKHNYLPFLFSFLKILAKKNHLKPLIEKAKRKI